MKAKSALATFRHEQRSESHAFRKRSGQRAAWWFVAPALIVLGVFFFLPVLAALAMSLTDFDLYALDNFDNLRWIGFENYARLLREPLFWKALGNTLYFVALGVPREAVTFGHVLADECGRLGIDVDTYLDTYDPEIAQPFAGVDAVVRSLERWAPSGWRGTRARDTGEVG